MPISFRILKLLEIREKTRSEYRSRRDSRERLVEKIVDMYAYYGFNTQVLAASIRHTQHIIQCIEAGADVATCPLSAIKGLLKHPLTDSGLATFLADHKKVNS